LKRVRDIFDECARRQPRKIADLRTAVRVIAKRPGFHCLYDHPSLPIKGSNRISR